MDDNYVLFDGKILQTIWHYRRGYGGKTNVFSKMLNQLKGIYVGCHINDSKCQNQNSANKMSERYLIDCGIKSTFQCPNNINISVFENYSSWSK